MKRNKEAIRIARQLLRASFAEGKLDGDRARAMVDKLKEIKPRGYVQILEVYLKLLRMELEKRHAVVESAVPLDPGMQHTIQEDLAKSYGGGLTLEFRVEPTLLGGMRVQVGSDVWGRKRQGAPGTTGGRHSLTGEKAEIRKMKAES